MNIRKILLTTLSLTTAFLLLKYDQAVSDSALAALSTCIRLVIPSLFPYMVLSSFIIALDLAEPLYRLIPMSTFRLPSCTAPVFLTGLLCGAPTSAAGCASLCENGRITKNEAARLCALSSHTSPAFLIGTVGALWGSKSFGIVLYMTEVMFTLVNGIVLRFRKDEAHSSACMTAINPMPKAIPALCKSVTDAASSCLAITGFIVFFRVACTIASTVLPPLADLFSATFEFSSGAVQGAKLGGISGAALTGFAVGFSGFSVFMQILRFLSASDIPFAPLFKTKLAEGIVTAAVAVLYYLHSPMQPTADALSLQDILSAGEMLVPLFFIISLHFAGHFLLPQNYVARRS